jgi:hypothetical protein
MKILTRTQFLALPAGVLFAKYTPSYFGPLELKDSTCGENDFFSLEIASAIEWKNSDEMLERLDRAEAGESIAMDFDTVGRDGLFDRDQLFAVWESADVAAFLATIQKSQYPQF